MLIHCSNDIERMCVHNCEIAGAEKGGMFVCSLLREIRKGFISGRYWFRFEYPKVIKQFASHSLLQDILIICQYSEVMFFNRMECIHILLNWMILLQTDVPLYTILLTVNLILHTHCRCALFVCAWFCWIHKLMKFVCNAHAYAFQFHFLQPIQNICTMMYFIRFSQSKGIEASHRAFQTRNFALTAPSLYSIQFIFIRNAHINIWEWK